ncbi:podocalyxin [Anabas testudineus]|uniref:Podocalyxin n=1 Tax=Anabas testudineus TaxID=64144 RepID=A0A3Q1JT46_ANATE|nr:podocalyxin [Anabas testudineus]
MNSHTTLANKPTIQSPVLNTANSPLQDHSIISATPSSGISDKTYTSHTSNPQGNNPLNETQEQTTEQPKTFGVTIKSVSKSSKTQNNPVPQTTSTSRITSQAEITNGAHATQMPRAQETNRSPGPGATSETSTQTTPGSLATIPKTGVMTPVSITTRTTTTTIHVETQPKTFHYSLKSSYENKEEKEFVEVCKRLMANLIDGECDLTWQQHNNKVQFERVTINGKVKTSLANQYYEELTKKTTDNKTLIAILASCGALLIMIVILAVCASHHRKPYNETQQHLTEELHTVENGYHDNPTLEVMEVQPEMQEKKMALNGEFNDSWIVPIDNLLKEDMLDEEDTHL